MKISTDYLGKYSVPGPISAYCEAGNSPLVETNGGLGGPAVACIAGWLAKETCGRGKHPAHTVHNHDDVFADDIFTFGLEL